MAISWTLRWTIPLALLSIIVVWRLVSTAAPHELFQDDNVKGTADLTDDRPLTFLYQSRLDQIGWLKGQCEFCRSIIQANQTVFPYLEVPPLLEEFAEQFNVPLKARIAVLHLWSSDESLAPPFFQYWLASAMANDRIADFLHFVPDNATAVLLQRLMPASSSSNIRVHIVGDLADFCRSRIGPTLEKANYQVSGNTLSQLKPMLGYVFQDYIDEYSHWAWADMDMIMGNLTKFLVRPLAEGYNVISMSSVEQSKNNTWSSHVCSRFKVGLAGQLTVFTNTNQTRNYFRQGDLSELRYRYDEGPFPALLQKLGIRVAHVFAQVTDQFGYLDDSRFDWSPQGLLNIGADGGCYEYEAALVHVMKGKRLVRPKKRSQVVVTHSSGSALDSKTLEQTIFPGPFVWENTSGFVMTFPIASSAPCLLYSGPSDISRECESSTH